MSKLVYFQLTISLLRCNPIVSRGTSVHTKYTRVCIHTYLYTHTYVYKHIHKCVYVDIKLLGTILSSFISFLLSDSFSVVMLCVFASMEFSADPFFRDLYPLFIRCHEWQQGLPAQALSLPSLPTSSI